MEPFISIILPTRDRPGLVKPVLQLLQQQTLENFEVIVSDNAFEKSCEDMVFPFLADKRFKYKKSPGDMNMCAHWDFAIQGAKGKYVSIFSEKFLMRRDAFEILYEAACQTDADILTWQYDYIDNGEIIDGEVHGTYHPLMKPTPMKFYSPEAQLRRRFSCDFPVFSRFNKSQDGYGKIYSGCVKRSLVNSVEKTYGRVFWPQSPDFTSMCAFLNNASVCVDVGESLMLVLNMEGTSNGEATRVSLVKSLQYMGAYCKNIDEYAQALPIPGCFFGHNNPIAGELRLIQRLADKGPIKDLTLDLTALAFWVYQDMNHVTEWGTYKRDAFEQVLAPYLFPATEEKVRRREELEVNLARSIRPNPLEIYHSGLEKVDTFSPSWSAKALAEIHWVEGKAPPRKHLGEHVLSVQAIESYFYSYNKYARQFLGVNTGILK
ncbi:hypothetical protein C4K68_05130 [Pokkaliibacter plantistimulans]|uniref:Glycosyltransferase 2-like domain-containing protein n=1 Tax=Proteobacteria bacterium 228 TaxID=2083153 RepID=A0A2S5KVY3_9PROT|nr:glycosyltransferase [Pokkaliibacter plantistimulans]PPC78436.1 hypothetical protein C4K68_05130 [Pokkaliibacter plantistimulans]